MSENELNELKKYTKNVFALSTKFVIDEINEEEFMKQLYTFMAEFIKTTNKYRMQPVQNL